MNNKFKINEKVKHDVKGICRIKFITANKDKKMDSHLYVVKKIKENRYCFADEKSLQKINPKHKEGDIVFFKNNGETARVISISENPIDPSQSYKYFLKIIGQRANTKDYYTTILEDELKNVGLRGRDNNENKN